MNVHDIVSLSVKIKHGFESNGQWKAEIGVVKVFYGRQSSYVIPVVMRCVVFGGIDMCLRIETHKVASVQIHRAGHPADKREIRIGEECDPVIIICFVGTVHYFRDHAGID